MKWNKGNKAMNLKPYHGLQEVVTCFAWFPIRCNDEIIWLERVSFLREYLIDPVGRWRNVEFINLK